ncbi:two-component sensor histidine kinase [Adhaeribacter aerolatus]|uniref:histidine kinase n=1 Tax=Adhaeribacter aerolatus TaxID=670289 RepID=A0A512B5C5_9BACT|nr:two-component sensor histidine kinase [Adhaeribacter aerolatus]
MVSIAKYAWKIIDTDQENSLKLYHELVKLGHKLGYDYWIAIGWLNIGYIDAAKANDKQAIADFRKAIPYFRKENKINDVAACLLNIGACSERIGELDTRINATMEAIRLLENTEYKPMLAQANLAMGVMYYNLNKFKKGLAYFQKGVTLARAAKDTTKLINGLFGVTNCLSSLQDFSGGHKHATEALRLAKASGKGHNLTVANTCFSEMYIKAKNAPRVIYYSGQILKHAIASADTHYQLIAYINLAEGYNLAHNYQKRIYYLNKALAIGQEKGVTIQLDDIYKGLSEAYSGLNQHQQALNFYKKYTVYRDSTTNERDNKNIAELEIKYQTAQKEKALTQKKLQLAQKDLQLQNIRQYKLISIAAALIAFLTASLIYLNFRHKRKLHARQLQTVQQEKEIQVLQALMQGEEKERSRIAKDLHDGVAGMLVAAKMHVSSLGVQHAELATSKSYRQTQTLLDEASYEVRKTAHNLMPEMLMRFGLDEALRRYCHNISNENTLVVQYDSWGDIKRHKNSFELSVYRIVQELLNNIIKHSQASHAIVQLSCRNNILSATIEDNGIGFDKHAAKTDGLELRSLQSRVQAINGKLEVETEAGSGVSAYLEFQTSGLEMVSV